MYDLQTERYYFELLIHGNNVKQKSAVLKAITEQQYRLLKCIANDILDEIIPLNKKQFEILVQYKEFIRKLSSKKISKPQLVVNIEAIIEILKVVYTENEMGKQTCTSTNRGMGKSKEISSKEKSIKYHRRRTSTSSEPEFSDVEHETDDEEFWNEQITEEQDEGLTESEE